MKSKEEIKKIAKEHAKAAGKELVAKLIGAIFILIGCAIAIYFLKNTIFNLMNDIVYDGTGTSITEKAE